MPGRHLPPNRSAGDESTLGGYMAVHARPAAFDGPDGMPYSVEIMVDRTDDAQPFAAYLLFMQWRRVGQPGIDSHLETEYLARGATPDDARAAIGRMSLHDVKATLDGLVTSARGVSERKWYDAMKDEPQSHDERGGE